MSLIRLIILFIVGYFLYRGIKYIFNLMAEQQQEQFNRNPEHRKSKIDKKDIVEADFEEIDTKEEEKK